MKLAGRNFVLTRPLGQNESLARLLAAEGATTLEFPVTEIAPLEDPAALHELAARLADFTLAFFVSPNAVAQTFAVIAPQDWPAKLAVATVGPTSAKTLRACGFGEVIVPESRFDSEGVLALPPFQAEALAGRRVLILRGNGGREFLAETLRTRGAEVECVTCYRRSRANPDPARLLAQHLDGIVFSSSEAVQHFIEISGQTGRELLARLPVFAPHSRILAAASACGAHHPMLTAAGDKGIVTGILETPGLRLG